jgi:general secretion pathway protein M
MTMISATDVSAGRRRSVAVLAYFAIVAAMLALALWLVADLKARSDAVSASQTRLAQIESRARPASAPGAQEDAQGIGSPFLEGETITVAGAALQQRVNAAVAKAGGAVRSSQIELEGPQAKDGFVSLTASIEIGQAELQPLLYDLEAGMPYLFIDSLAVQSPQSFGEAETARMRVVIGVSGQWQAKQ